MGVWRVMQNNLLQVCILVDASYGRTMGGTILIMFGSQNIVNNVECLLNQYLCGMLRLETFSVVRAQCWSPLLSTLLRPLPPPSTHTALSVL